MPKVSIITPLFNGTAFIGEAVSSVRQQTFDDWEMIIVDDCSEDNPEKVLEPYISSDRRIKLIRLDRNSGAAAARNVALQKASGDFIAFLDSDDTWKPSKLERQTGLMEQNGWAFSFHSYEVMSQNGIPTGKIIHAPPGMNYRAYLKNTLIGCLTVVVDRRKTGDFTMPLIRSSHDMALWLELMKRGFNAFGINEPLASYRLVASSNTANKLKAAGDVWKVYREVEKLSVADTLYCFTSYAIHAYLNRI